MTLKPVVTGYGLVEGPVWDPVRGLLYSDVLYGGVYALNTSQVVTEVFGHRRGIGGMARHAAGGLLVSGRNIAFKRFGGASSVVLLDRDVEHGNVGYNDITTDPAGRVYAGSLGSSPVFDDGLPPRGGNLYLIDLDGSSRQVADDVHLTNGLGFSPDGATLYHADSRRQQLMFYPVKSNGDLGEKQVFATFASGTPDGLAVAEDGSVWVANPVDGGVCVFDRRGQQTDFVAIDVPMCTSVCFGGNDLKTLFVVSGSEGAASERAGGVYSLEVDVAGLPVAEARIALRR